MARYLWPVARAPARHVWRGWCVHRAGRIAHEGDAGLFEGGLGVATAHRLETRQDPVLLVGQSIGNQLAAHPAVQVPGLVRLLLRQGPTVYPAYRTAPRLLTAGCARRS